MKGAAGWQSTGATVAESTIIASAKPPVKHMPERPDARSAELLVQLAGQRPEPPGDGGRHAGGQLRELPAHAQLRKDPRHVAGC